MATRFSISWIPAGLFMLSYGYSVHVYGFRNIMPWWYTWFAMFYSFRQVLLQLLSRVLSGSSLCEQGPWDIGNTLLDICTIVLRTETVFRGSRIVMSTCMCWALFIVLFRYLRSASADCSKIWWPGHSGQSSILPPAFADCFWREGNRNDYLCGHLYMYVHACSFQQSLLWLQTPQLDPA